MPDISVIICTHNPRPDYLARVLEAIKTQTLPKDQWELLLVDNNCQEPLSCQWDLSWHVHARHIREEDLGLTPARLRGIKESQGDLLVFVDDDNVLDADYLEQAWTIAGTHGFLGVWGGHIIPEFESEPPPWIESFRLTLACVEVAEDRWSNLKFYYGTVPPGAGMCVRRPVADEFMRVANADPRRRLLGRRGTEGLGSGEDTDLALTACDLGLGTGQFTRLKMTHLIPSVRLQEAYIIKLCEAIGVSGIIVEALRGRRPEPFSSSLIRAWLGRLRRRLFWNPRRRALFEGSLRARKRAGEIIARWR